VPPRRSTLASAEPSFGGLVMVLEHHQQRTGNAIQAKGYIVKAAIGCIVISLATSIVSGVQSLVS